MLKYVVNRLLSLIPVILVTSFLIYWAMSLTEGDPAMMIAGDGASKEMIDQIRHDLGLDQPFLLQYFNYMIGMLVGDMGKSYVTNKDVFHTFFQYLPNTLYLGGAAVMMFSSIVVSGIQLITKWPIGPRNVTIVSVALGLGYGLGSNTAILVHLPQAISLIFGGSGIVPAAVFAIILNIVLPKDEKSEIERAEEMLEKVYY